MGKQGNSDTNPTPTGTGQDATPDAKPTATAQQPVTAPDVKDAAPAEDPGWLEGRLKRERETFQQEWLQALGVKGMGDLKQVLKVDTERKEAAKTAEQKLSETKADLKTKSQAYDALHQEFTAIVDAEIEAIPEEHRETANELLDIAGEDPVARMKALRKLKPLLAPSSGQKPAPPNIDGAAGTGGAAGQATPYSQEQEQAIARRYGATGLT